jgi:hypothetical protein
MEAKPDEETKDSKPHLGGSQKNRQRPQKVEDNTEKRPCASQGADRIKERRKKASFTFHITDT